MRAILILCAFCLAFSAVFNESAAAKKPVKKTTKKTAVKKTAKPKKKAEPAKVKDVILSDTTIFKAGKIAIQSGVYTKLHQIDILSNLFYRYRSDSAILNGEKRVIITGSYFGRAFARLEPLFENSEDGGGTKFLESAKPPPRIEYENFQTITLSYGQHSFNISVLLEREYEQEIPYTFGARINLKKEIGGVVRTNSENTITEVIFSSYRQVRFSPPGIAFFVPDVYVKIASVCKEGGEVYGFVIGVPKNDPTVFSAVRYNLSSCSKASIKTYELSAYQFKKKLANVGYYGFVY